jgi:hypothetical protein
MDNPEKLATLGTQDTKRRQAKQKHNTICVGHHYTQTNCYITNCIRNENQSNKMEGLNAYNVYIQDIHIMI